MTAVRKLIQSALAVGLARPGDVIFTMGAGDVVEVGPKIVELLQ